MAGLSGVDRRIVELIEGQDLRVVTKDLNANTVTHFVTGSLNRAKRAIQQLQGAFPSADIDLRKVAQDSVSGLRALKNIPPMPSTFSIRRFLFSNMPPAGGKCGGVRPKRVDFALSPSRWLRYTLRESIGG